jgi:hypothetical protein
LKERNEGIAELVSCDMESIDAWITNALLKKAHSGKSHIKTQAYEQFLSDVTLKVKNKLGVLVEV